RYTRVLLTLLLYIVVHPGITAQLYYNFQLSSKLAAIREYHADLISTRKREAEESQRLLRPTVERKIASEREKDGLIIVEALYGNLRILNDGITKENEGEVFDVTVAVQALVHDSQLVIPGGRSKV